MKGANSQAAMVRSHRRQIKFNQGAMTPGSFRSPNRPGQNRPHFFDQSKGAYADAINQEDEKAVAVRDEDDFDAEPSVSVPME